MKFRFCLMSLILIASGVLLTGCLGGMMGSASKSASPETPAASAEEIQAQINKATALAQQGSYTQALPEFLKAREMAPQNADVENFLGLTYYNLKENTLAVDSYQKALALNPKRSDVHNNLGLVYLAQRNYDQALARFNLCLKDVNYQKKHLPLTNMGVAYLEMGRYDEAQAALTRATEVAPDYAKAYQHLGEARLAKGQYKEAGDSLGQAVRLNPGDPDTLMLLGDALARQNRGQEAAAAYNQAAALVPPESPLALDAQKRASQVSGIN